MLIVLLVTCLTVLVACSPVDQVYMKVEGSSAQFITCEPIQAEALSVQRIPVGSSDVSLWEDAWVVEGISNLEPAAKVTFGVAPDGMRTALEPSSLLVGNWDVKLIVDGIAEDGRLINIVGEWQTSQFEEGVWYADDGNRPETAPCEDSRDSS
jgi:hypothetical protein